MRSAFAASVRVLATFVWSVAKVIFVLIALVVFMIVLSIVVGPLLDAVGPDGFGADIVWALYAAAVMVFMFLLFRWNFGKRFWTYPGGPWTDAHTLGLRRRVQEEVGRHCVEPPGPHP